MRSKCMRALFEGCLFTANQDDRLSAAPLRLAPYYVPSVVTRQGDSELHGVMAARQPHHGR